MNAKRLLSGQSLRRLMVLFVLAAQYEMQAQTVVYQTGFQAPTYALGNLAGQNGWSSGIGVSQNAAQIIIVSGTQELQISGSQVGPAGPNVYECSFSHSLANYNPVASGTPIVDVSADLWQQQGLTTSQSSWQFAFLILRDQNGNAYGTIGIDKHGIVFGQNWATTNQVIGDGDTATNGFRHFNMELNFTNRMITIFKDGFSIGTMTFNNTAGNELGSVMLILQGGNPIDSTLFVDNLSVTVGTTVTASPCDLQITSAGPWSKVTGGAPGPPKVGDIYELYVKFNVCGTPTNAFRIKWTMANITYYVDNIRIRPGTGYSQYFKWWLDLDDPIPWSVTLDPDGVSGDTNIANNYASGTFTPVPPTNAVDLYSPRMMHGSETYTLDFTPGSGVIPNLYVLFGVPTTHGAQRAVSVSGPPDSTRVITPPYGVPVFEIARTNVPASTFQDTNYFVVQLSRIRVNPDILRTATWADMGALATHWSRWIAPDQRVQSTNALITSFVRQSLPTNFLTALTPYDTARTLHRAVMRALKYQSPPLHLDAVGVLQDGVADCGGFAALLTACLRNVGIPARCISGFRQGDTVWHVRVEFHLPGVDWLVADPTDGNANDPTGTYAYDFGDVRNADHFLAVDVGDAHVMPYNTFEFIQVPNWWWNGGATFNSYSAVSYLQPNGVLCMTNSPKGSIRFYLSDAPTEGSVVIQRSADLTTWLPVVTNSVNGAIVNYSFPATNGPCGFYRAVVSP